MNKLNHMRLIGLASLSAQQLSPITKVKDSVLYNLLLHKFEKVERWRNTKKVTQKIFEKQLERSRELVDEYLEVYHKDATYYKCAILYSGVQFDYYIMMRKNKIVLFFYLISKAKITNI